MVMLNGYGHMVDFFTSIRWWTMNPDDERIGRVGRPAATTKTTTPNGEPSLWSSAKDAVGGPAVTALRSAGGDLAVLYFAHGGQANVDGRRLADGVQAEWYNPRAGSRRPARPISPNSFHAPDEEDWGLLLRKP